MPISEAWTGKGASAAKIGKREPTSLADADEMARVLYGMEYTFTRERRRRERISKTIELKMSKRESEISNGKDDIRACSEESERGRKTRPRRRSYVEARPSTLKRHQTRPIVGGKVVRQKEET